MEKIKPPSLQVPADAINADLTPAGRLYQRECKTGCGYLFCRCCYLVCVGNASKVFSESVDGKISNQEHKNIAK
jgi:hypothetical protein